MTLPRLSLGTASMLGRASRRQSELALTNAYTAGIRDFDTARSYGWGQAEGLLGKFLEGRPRSEFRVVTKCGIAPIRPSSLSVVARSFARSLLRVAPSLLGSVRKVAGTTAFRPQNTDDIDVLKASLQTSLAELRLSYVDTLLLHNFEPANPQLDAIAQWFADLQREGTARRTGFSIQGDLHAGLEFLSGKGWLEGSVIQVPVSAELLSLPAEWRNETFIAHSPFAFLTHQAATGGKVRTLHDLLLALESSCSCEAVICSMFTPAHLQANVAAWKSPG